MLETMYDVSERNSVEAESVMDFASLFLKDGEMEEMFYNAIRDSRLSGFREGMKAALMLFAEVQ